MSIRGVNLALALLQPNLERALMHKYSGQLGVFRAGKTVLDEQYVLLRIMCHVSDIYII